ncbi:putative secreted protein (Por secretion system target) [Mesonia algae]|uniref:Putative secreted protein (Por secretion system target) n=1 Tax=Mesonia algae TaxID=213248 RepID=A0A2W7ICK1_9FLAO|nr:T9SS type A sorting domain-containing protein [Mesonia algae]PZW43828.1 putative secreted protein (Por secretion system target) [Mesonia algae]
MKKITFLMSFMFIAITSMAQTPIITMISDGDCPGGLPKVVEIYADGAVDFSNYSLVKSPNGGDFSSTLNLTDLGTVTDDFVYVYKDGTDDGDNSFFDANFPNATNKLATTSDAANFNGDDPIRLVLDSDMTVIDQYGNQEDGTDTAWEYKDGYAKRNNGTLPNGAFNAGDWTFNNGVLDGEGLCQGGNSFESIIGIGTFTPGTVACPLIVTLTSVTCDTETTGATSDTYTVTGTFTGGGTEVYTFTINEGTVVSTDEISSMEEGTITVTGIPEGTDLIYSITSSSCDIEATVPSPECEPSSNVSNIAALREGTVGNIYTLTGEAFLTYQQSFRNQKYIQDATAAILIDDNDGNITTTYTVGDGITNITGELSEFNGIMQFIPESDPGEATSNNNDVAPQVLMVADFMANSEIYESELIAFADVTIADIAEGDGTYQTGENYDLTQGSDVTTLRTNFFDAAYIGTALPSSTVNVVGIASQFNDEGQIFPTNVDANLSASSNTLTNVSIYPNPSNTGLVTIETASNEAAAVEVYNLLGKQVISQTLTNSTLNVANLSSGVYLVKVSVEGKSATKKLVIE